MRAKDWLVGGYKGEHDRGWDKITKPLIEKLTDLNGHILQIKEKYGTLRFYYCWDHDHLVPDEDCDEFQNMVDNAERLSSKTCEICGEPGELRGYTWVKTLCDAHDEDLGLFSENAKLAS